MGEHIDIESEEVQQYRSVRYRIKATPAKYRKLADHGHACRFVWNHFVAKTRKDYEAWKAAGEAPDARPSVSFFSLGKEFTQLRRQDPWLQRLSATNVKSALDDLAKAYRQFFRNPGPDGPPGFKSVKTTPLSFPLADNRRFSLQGDRLRIEKIGSVRINGSNPYRAEAVSGRVKEENGKWYAVIAYKVNEDDIKQAGPIEKAVGIDRNVGQAALSDGRIIRMPRSKRLEARRRRHQRAMARKVKGSNRYKKAKASAAKAALKIRNARTNWQHQTTRLIANEYGGVILEDLNTKGMTKSARGTVEEPGKNVAQKRGLNRSIQDSAWHRFERMLDYKAREVVKINPAYTSQTCNECGAADKASRKSQAEFRCSACGHEDNADINAAKNILAAGMAATARGGGGDARPEKREYIAGEAA